VDHFAKRKVCFLFIINKLIAYGDFVRLAGHVGERVIVAPAIIFIILIIFVLVLSLLRSRLLLRSPLRLHSWPLPSIC
jgi:hypothetical protein